MTITLDNSIFEKYFEACDLFLTNDYLSKECLLVYPGKKIVCNTCTVKNIGGLSTNIYAHGGNAPFNFGSCSYCGGNGYKMEETTDTIRLRIYFERRSWIKISEVNFPNAIAQCIGYASDESKIRRANEIRLINDQTHATIRTVLDGPILPHGFRKRRYFICHLKMI